MPDPETVLFPVVFALFGLEVLVRFGAWCFHTYRAFCDMRDEYDTAEDVTAPPG